MEDYERLKQNLREVEQEKMLLRDMRRNERRRVREQALAMAEKMKIENDRPMVLTPKGVKAQEEAKAEKASADGND